MVRRRAIALVSGMAALAQVGCGRLDFDALTDAGGAPAGEPDGALD
jgi:hypothetical protein